MKTTIIKSILLIVTIFMSIQSIQSQKTIPTKEDKAILAREFARVATNSTFSNIGNFASISTDNKTLSSSFFFITDSYDVINVDVSGGATQGIAAIFQEGKLNTKASVEVSYNFMIRKLNNKNHAILINETKESGFKLAIKEEERKFQRKRLELFKETAKKKHDLDIKYLKDTIAKLNAFIKYNDSIIKDLMSNDKPWYKIKPYKELVEETKKKRKRIKRFLSITQKAQDRLDSISNSELSNIYRFQKKEKIDQLKKKIKEMKPYASSFSWISVGYKATNDAFSLFDESLPISEQLSKRNYTSQTLSLSYNHQSNANINRLSDGSIDNKIDFPTIRGRVYFSVGFKLSITHNLSSLNEVEVIDRTIVDPSTGREKVSKQNAFSGNYLNDLTNGLIHADYFKFFSSKEDIALHLSPTLLMRENFKPVTSFQIGVLVPFKDKEKQDTSVNIEFFYRINDIFNTANSKKSILNRNSIGLQAIFPFNF